MSDDPYKTPGPLDHDALYEVVQSLFAASVGWEQWIEERLKKLPVGAAEQVLACLAEHRPHLPEVVDGLTYMIRVAQGAATQAEGEASPLTDVYPLQTVRAALIQLGFTDAEFHLEATPGGNVCGHIISEQFSGQSQIERQRSLYNRLEAIVGSHVHRCAIALMAVTPEECGE